MKKLALAFFLAVGILACKEKSLKQIKVKIETPFGEMIAVLYNETPEHRDNFIKLTKDGFYDDLLFHRVIEEFMIQGGDPESKNADGEKRLGSGGPGYQIPAEIQRNLFHKRGALSAARQGDQVNPERKSSGSQFYIVQGKTFTDEELTRIEDQQNQNLKTKIFQEIANGYQDTIQALQMSGNQEGILKMRDTIIEKMEAKFATIENKFEIPEEQKEIYKTIGGTPFLDNAYTVFGEVIEGLDVIDSIAAQQTNTADRPLQDITMKITVLE